MTRDQAEQVKWWRDVQDVTWRELAYMWVREYGETELDGEFYRGWSGNQLAGMELHERAMAELGEHFE